MRRSRSATTTRLELALGGQTQRVDFFRLQLAQLARLKIENQWTVAYAANLFDVMADFFEHLAQLAVAALDDDHFVPGIVALADLADLGRSGAHAPGTCTRTASLDDYALAQRVEHVFRRLAGYLHQIGLFYAGGGLGELVGQFAVVGHQQQAFAEVIEASHGVQALVFCREELHYRWPALGIADGSDKALGLIEHEVANPLGALQQLAVHAHVVARGISLGAQFHHDLAVDLDSASEDQLFSFAAR